MWVSNAIIKRSFLNFSLLWDMYLQERSLVFDMDDTVYRETDFLYRAYKNIAIGLYGDSWELAYKFLCKRFKERGRENLFNHLLTEFPLNSEETGLDECLRIMRSSIFPDSLPVYPWFSKFIAMVNKPYELRIITNGNSQQQKNKFLSLRFNREDVTTSLVCANDYGGKPNAEAFFALKDGHQLFSPVYVGDSSIDYEFCRNSGMDFLDVNGSLTTVVATSSGT